MLLERCKDQASETLEEFYIEVSKGDSAVNREGGGAMLDLIARLRRLPDPDRAWGLTSLYRLCLLASDVSVAAISRTSYWIEYLMPESLAPWQGARVQGETHSEDEAVQMIVTAIDRSGGWAVSDRR
jgi:hypothetical protein